MATTFLCKRGHVHEIQDFVEQDPSMGCPEPDGTEDMVFDVIDGKPYGATIKLQCGEQVQKEEG